MPTIAYRKSKKQMQFYENSTITVEGQTMGNADRGTIPDFHYRRLANELEGKIVEGIFQIGERLPSIRELHKRTGLSISTVYQSYIELEKRALVEARPKSGYFVKDTPPCNLAMPITRKKALGPSRLRRGHLISSVIATLADRSLLQLGCTVISPELLPLKQFSRSIRNISKDDMARIVSYGEPQGASELRRALAKRMITGQKNSVHEDDIIITSGCMEGLALALRAVAGPGDTIAVESPTFFSLLQLIQDLQMVALEIPTHPQEGVDLASLAEATKKNRVRACLFISNFHNPMGCTIPDENKRKLVAFMNKKGIPLIEDDIYGDLNFQEPRPTTLKSFDQKGLVLYCASFSKTLAPGLRVGYVLPGKFKEKVARLKMNTTLTAPTLNQLILSDFLESGSYERHLRRLRNALKNQMRRSMQAISRYFPEETRITSPEGGFMLWVELPNGVSSLDVFRKALEAKISIVPGLICSNSGRYGHFLRISCGFPWNDGMEKGFEKLGRIIKENIN
jgi:DNA-binding transcriptional MocR family regulator